MSELSTLDPEEQWKKRAIANSLIQIQSHLWIQREKKLIDCLLNGKLLQIPESPASESNKAIL